MKKINWLTNHESRGINQATCPVRFSGYYDQCVHSPVHKRYAANVFQPDALDVDTFLILNFGIFLYPFVISGICFCSSCIFNSSKNSLIFGAGISLCFFVMAALAGCLYAAGILWFLKKDLPL